MIKNRRKRLDLDQGYQEISSVLRGRFPQRHVSAEIAGGHANGFSYRHAVSAQDPATRAGSI
jgi:hypothetical protein